MERPPLPPGLNASTFPARLWYLVNSPRVRSVRWDSLAQGLLVERSLFERELLSPAGALGTAPDTFKATRFGSFVRQLNLYGFQKVPGWFGAAVPGDPGAWLHFTNPNFRRDRPDLLLHIKRRTKANRQRLAAGLEVRSRQPSRFQQLRGAAPLCQNPGAVSPEGSELPPDPSRTSAAAQECEAFPAPPKEVFVTCRILGDSSEERGTRVFTLKPFSLQRVCMDPKRHPELVVSLVHTDHPSTSRAFPESSSCTSSEQQSPAASPSAPSCQNLGAVSPEDSELSPGPSRTSAAAQECEAFSAPPKKVFVTSERLGLSSEEPGTYKFQCQPELITPPAPVDHPSTSVVCPESSSCTSSEQHSPAYTPSATPSSSAPNAQPRPASYAAWMASNWPWNAPGEEELPPLDLDLVLETLEEMLSSSLPERSPFAQDNISFVPESSGGEPVQKAAAEGALPGTVSSRKSSLEPEEPDIHLIYLSRRAALRATKRPRESL